MRRPVPAIAVVATAAASLLAVTAGCPSREVRRIEPEDDGAILVEMPVQAQRGLDILFVIDDSGSMAEEQASLAANFPAFIAVLQSFIGGLPDVHIGVISTDVGAGGHAGVPGCDGDGDGGRLQAAPRVEGCAPPGPEPFIIDEDDGRGGRLRNHPGDLAATFGCIARLGTDGCGYEQPLDALHRALNDNPYNGGFLRDDAYLAIVIITDEDDCSAQDPYVFDPTTDPAALAALGPAGSFRCTEFGVTCAEGDVAREPASYTACRPRTGSYLRDPEFYADAVKSVKADPGLVLVAGIFGPPAPFAVGRDELGAPRLQPSCGAERGQPADPGVRLNDFIERFPYRFTNKAICDDDLADALILIAEGWRPNFVNELCLDGAVASEDLFPDLPGLQIDCQVSDVYMRGTDAEQQTPLPRCRMTSDTELAPDSPLPCWTARADPYHCPSTETGLALEIYPETRTAPPGTRVVARCRLE